MGFVVDTAQMKAAEKLCDEKYISYSKMMENAGNAVAERICSLHKLCHAAVVLCGSGNNGGDGFVIAARLLENGFKVRVILVNGEPETDCARRHFEKLPKKIICNFAKNEKKCVTYVQNAKIVVECVFGTGFHGTLPESAVKLFRAANLRYARYAVDLPGGVNSDTGEFDERCFRPTRTFMLAAMKKCVLVPDCRDILGKLEIIDIGIPGDCFVKDFTAMTLGAGCRECLPERAPSSHKGTFGRLLNIAGSLRYSGAAVMSTHAALRTGAGITTLAAPISVVKATCGVIPESTFLPLPETADGFVGEGAEDVLREVLPKMNAVMIGCGLGNSENPRKITEFVIRNASCPIIIDADGINSISQNINVLKERTGATIITPHIMEFSRISGLSAGEIGRDRIGAAVKFSREYGVLVVLKGANTVITDGNYIFVNTTGNPALAKGGSGDVLCGMIGGLLVQDPRDLIGAATHAVYCHGYAADLISNNMPQACVLAGDIIRALPKVYMTDSFNIYPFDNVKR